MTCINQMVKISSFHLKWHHNAITTATDAIDAIFMSFQHSHASIITVDLSQLQFSSFMSYHNCCGCHSCYSLNCNSHVIMIAIDTISPNCSSLCLAVSKCSQTLPSPGRPDYHDMNIINMHDNSYFVFFIIV